MACFDALAERPLATGNGRQPALATRPVARRQIEQHLLQPPFVEQAPKLGFRIPKGDMYLTPRNPARAARPKRAKKSTSRTGNPDWRRNGASISLRYNRLDLSFSFRNTAMGNRLENRHPHRRRRHHRPGDGSRIGKGQPAHRRAGRSR